MESMKFTWTVEFNNRGKNRTKPKIKIAKTSKVEEKENNTKAADKLSAITKRSVNNSNL